VRSQVAIGRRFDMVRFEVQSSGGWDRHGQRQDDDADQEEEGGVWGRG